MVSTFQYPGSQVWVSILKPNIWNTSNLTCDNSLDLKVC